MTWCRCDMTLIIKVWDDGMTHPPHYDTPLKSENNDKCPGPITWL